MSGLFEDNTYTSVLAPLPERMRPETLEDYVGQRHLVGEGCILRNMIASGNISSFILWGPPGVGKTTLAGIIAKTLDREFFTLSAVSAGVKDVREVIDRAKNRSVFSKSTGAPILFIDEIHRFNKAQQDAFLPVFSYLLNNFSDKGYKSRQKQDQQVLHQFLRPTDILNH